MTITPPTPETPPFSPETLASPAIDRRGVLRLAGLAAAVLLAEACSPGSEDATDTARASDDTTPPDTPAETNAPPAERYALHERVVATIFWIGEAANASNDFISNAPTAWDENAAERFGGADGSTAADTSASDVPRDSNGIVTGFTPRHNPYYFALPAAEFDENGLIAGARERSPWANEAAGLADSQSLFKGRYARITTTTPAGEERTVYAQWLDVGPNEEMDYDYVFGDGSQPPLNSDESGFGLGAGIDLSRAAATMLGFDDGGITVSWQFVDPSEVPEGPWSDYPPVDNQTHWG